MKAETKEQVIERLALCTPMSKLGLKNLLEMAYDAGKASEAPGEFANIDQDGKLVVRRT